MNLKLEIKDSAGTLKYKDDFHVTAECDNIFNSMKGKGTDETAMIKFLSTTSNYQKQVISAEYTKLYNKNLTDQVKSELSGDFKHLAVALMKKDNEFAQDAIVSATKGIGTNETLLIAVLLSKSNTERAELIKTYNSSNKKTLQALVKSETSGVMRTFLTGLLDKQRDELSDCDNQTYIYNNNVEQLIDRELAKQQAEQANELLNSKGKIKDTSVFNEIFIHQNRYQAAACLQECHSLTGKDFLDCTEHKLSKDDQKLITLIVLWTIHPVGFYSNLLQKAFHGAGTDEDLLNFVIVNRHEKDLLNIMNEYEKSTGKSLSKSIHSESSGDYQKLLMSLIA